MHNFLVQWGAWWLGLLLEALIVSALLLKKSYRQWPTLLLYNVGAVIAALVCRGMLHNRVHYFYSYWVSLAALSLLRIFVLADVIRALPGIPFLGLRSRWTIGSMAAVVGALGWRLALSDTSRVSENLPNYALTLQRCSSLAWLGTVAFILIVIAFLRIGWERRGAVVMIGLGFKVCGAAIVPLIYGIDNAWSRTAGKNVETWSSILCLALWYIALRVSPDVWVTEISDHSARSVEIPAQ